MSARHLTQPRDAWSVRAGVFCTACTPTEWYGVPAHARRCPLEAREWFVLPPLVDETTPLLATLAWQLDPGRTPHPDFEARQALRALHYLTHAAWRVYHSRTED